MRVNAHWWHPSRQIRTRAGVRGGFRAALFLWEARFVEALLANEDRRAPLETKCESSCYYAMERDGPVARTP
jgi:hypothetical protein